jgi:hypothetical protein
VPPRWRLVLGFSDACWCSRKLPGGVLRLSSFASCFPACFRFLFRCFDRSATFSFLFRCLAPIGSLSLLFDFAGAADAMSPLRVGSGGDETVVGRLVSPGCRLCLLALLFFLSLFGCYALLSILVFGACNLVLQGSVS